MAQIYVENVVLYKSLVETVRLSIEDYLSETEFDDTFVAEVVVENILEDWIVSSALEDSE